jgi:hypothetical protein
MSYLTAFHANPSGDDEPSFPSLSLKLLRSSKLDVSHYRLQVTPHIGSGAAVVRKITSIVSCSETQDLRVLACYCTFNHTFSYAHSNAKATNPSCFKIWRDNIIIKLT